MQQSAARALNGRSGVYVIRDKGSKEVLDEGESTPQLAYATLTRHFQTWSGNTAGALLFTWRG